MKKGNVGFLAILVKLGPKLVTALLKLVKGLKVGKVAMAGASMAAYSFLFTWKFALIILFSLFFHELGHLWAMKRCGMKTRGLYFIPLIGAAAVADEEFHSRTDEAYIALMGPIWGLALALVVTVVYFVTDNNFFAAVAGWMALVNIFNLLPINPLDGGRVFKSVAFSLSSWVGKAFLLVGMIAGVILSFRFNFILFAMILLISGTELFFEMRRPKESTFEKMGWPAIAKSLIGYVVLAGMLLGIMFYCQHVPGADAALAALQG